MDQIDVFAVAAGPGSFTGLRVGLTAVKAWAEVYGKPIAAISGLEAIAAESMMGESPAALNGTLMSPFLDARRGQLFGAIYRRFSEDDPRLALASDESILSLDEFLALIEREDPAAGPACLSDAGYPACGTLERSSAGCARRSSVRRHWHLRSAGWASNAQGVATWWTRSASTPTMCGVPTPNRAGRTGNALPGRENRQLFDYGRAPDVSLRRFRGTLPMEAILKESPEASIWSKESLLESAFKGEVLGCRVGWTPVGILIGRVAADEFEIFNLAVGKAFRRRGIATQLVRASLASAQTAGARNSYLEVRASNERAIAFYERMGFQACGRRPNYYRGPDEDAVLLIYHNRISTQ